MRGVTCIIGEFSPITSISTHTPRAGSDQREAKPLPREQIISTHTPRAGSDEYLPKGSLVHGRFQPTLPVRGVTFWLEAIEHRIIISTHTPRAGSDLNLLRCAGLEKFQPTLPVRGVTLSMPQSSFSESFQPTLPVRGVTQFHQYDYDTYGFQPTLPVRGVTTPY